MFDYSAKVLADSVSEDGVRLTTLELVIPRFVLAEFNTHRVFSRNSASSRAIPTVKLLRNVLENPFVPHRFSRNQAGMQASEYWVPGDEQYEVAKQNWLELRDYSVIHAVSQLAGRAESGRLLYEYSKTGTLNVQDVLDTVSAYEERRKNKDLLPTDLNVHKQLVNRALENWTWQTIVVSATEWSNFIALREHFDAQDQISIPATLTREALEGSTPRLVREGEWHLPLVLDEELDEVAADPERWKKISAGRCARVSYLTHDGRRDPEADVRLFQRLADGGHMSPLEHVATPEDGRQWYGNFRGWKQYRKFFTNEDDYAAVLKEKQND